MVCDYEASYCRGGPYRVKLVDRTITQHEGIDFAGRIGSPVISASYGVVESKSYGYCGGTVIVRTEIKSKNHYLTGNSSILYLRYNHIDPDDSIDHGVAVEPGQIIGTLQNPLDIRGRGNCISEPHLHFAMHFTYLEKWHVDPSRHWVDGPGKVTCFSPKIKVPRDKLVAPVPC